MKESQVVRGETGRETEPWRLWWAVWIFKAHCYRMPMEGSEKGVTWYDLLFREFIANPDRVLIKCILTAIYMHWFI